MLRCVNTRNAFSLFDTFVNRMKKLAAQNRCDNNRPITLSLNNEEVTRPYDHSFQACLAANGKDWRNFTGE